MNHRKLNHLKALQSLGFKASQFNRLRQIENLAHWRAENYANGKIGSQPFGEKEWEMVEFEVIKALKKLNPSLPDSFFVNADPRGYALKIDNEKATIPQGMHTDWGGYGILAPDPNDF